MNTDGTRSDHGTGEEVRALEKVETSSPPETVPSTDMTRCEARHGSNKNSTGTYLRVLFPFSTQSFGCKAVQGVPSTAMHAFDNSGSLASFVLTPLRLYY